MSRVGDDDWTGLVRHVSNIADLRYAIGGIAASSMMSVTNTQQPYYWQLPVYIEMGLVGFMGLCFIFIPETPWYYGRRGNKDGCLKTMQRLYSNVDDYDKEQEWGIIERSIQHEKDIQAQSSALSWSAIFRGTNGVSSRMCFAKWFSPTIKRTRELALINLSETNVDSPSRLHRSTSRRKLPHFNIFNLFLPIGWISKSFQCHPDPELCRSDRDSILFHSYRSSRSTPSDFHRIYGPHGSALAHRCTLLRADFRSSDCLGTLYLCSN